MQLYEFFFLGGEGQGKHKPVSSKGREDGRDDGRDHGPDASLLVSKSVFPGLASKSRFPVLGLKISCSGPLFVCVLLSLADEKSRRITTTCSGPRARSRSLRNLKALTTHSESTPLFMHEVGDGVLLVIASEATNRRGQPHQIWVIDKVALLEFVPSGSPSRRSPQRMWRRINGGGPSMSLPSSLPSGHQALAD